MTEKRYGIWNYVSCDVSSIVDKSNNNLLNIVDACELLNSLSEENEQLKTQLQNVSDQRDEFHRGARENANRVGKLEKENEQLNDSLLSTSREFQYGVKKVQKLAKENEQLKKENKRLKERLDHQIALNNGLVR